MTEQERYENMVDEIIDLKNKIKDLQAEIERFKNDLAISRKETKRYKNSYLQCAYEREMFLNELNDAKAEAYKEFAERLHEYINGIIERHEMPMFPFSITFVSGIETKIDNLLKEMVGDTDV